MSKSLFTYRSRKHDKRPNIIVGANRTKFRSMGLTSKRKSGNHNNFPLLVNPEENSKYDEAYLKKRIIEDFKFNYSKPFKNFKSSDSDNKRIAEYLKNKKK